MIPQKARDVLDFTRADGVMIGRAKYGAPWIFRAVNSSLTTQKWIDEKVITGMRSARYRARTCVVSSCRTSKPCTPSTAKTPGCGSHANISAGISHRCLTPLTHERVSWPRPLPLCSLRRRGVISMGGSMMGPHERPDCFCEGSDRGFHACQQRRRVALAGSSSRGRAVGGSAAAESCGTVLCTIISRA